jgi:hypothetical protein
MLHGPSEYGVDDGKFSEYYRAYERKISFFLNKIFLIDPVKHQ